MTIEDKTGSNADTLERLLEGDSVPEKFRGKTVKEALNSYHELQTAFGRQGQEVGELRRLTTSLVDMEARPSKEEPVKKPVDTESLLADPDKAINDAIENHPVVKQARVSADQLERQLAVSTLEKKHPGFRETVTDQGFRNWVEGNPALTRLAVQADRFDTEAADTLFSLWKEKQSLQTNVDAKVKENETRKQKERDATLEGGSGSDSSSETVLNRAELIDLHRRAQLGDAKAKAKWNDPKFRAMRLNAYRDKRVS